jgi:restriction endonuclease
MTARKKSQNVKSPKTGQRSPAGSTSKQKGKLVERIAAMLHEGPDVKVERNVLLPPLNGDPKRKREIDVLLTSYVAGYPVRIAIECKNEAEKNDVEYIDAFVGKLDDVGIPHQHGIFISVSGYTSGAIDRAKAKGIRTLVLTGLTEDRLSEAISNAYQYTVFLLPVVKRMTFTTGDPKVSEMLGFQNESGNICGLLPDLVWFQWQEGQIPATLGEHEIRLPIPSGWQPVVDGRPTQLLEPSTATVEVIGIVLKLTGKARRHSLIDAHAKTTDRFRLNVDFNLQRLQRRRVTFRPFSTEEKLKAWMEKHGDIRLVSRLKLPRLQLLNRFYYPMSARVASIVMTQQYAYETGQSSVCPIFTFSDLEGGEIKNAWEPIWQGHYAIWNQSPRHQDQGKAE